MRVIYHRDLHVRYCTPEPDAATKSVKNFSWAVRTAHRIHGKRTVSLRWERGPEPDDGPYFFWASAVLGKRPPGAVQKAADLCELDGDYGYGKMANAIVKAARRHLPVDDPHPPRTRNYFRHHVQYKHPRPNIPLHLRMMGMFGADN